MELTAAEWERIEALLPEALSLPRGEREHFLRRNCSGSDRLRAELESLIAAGDTAERFLVAPVALTSDAAPEPDLLAGGTRLGPWKVGDKIGRGGMGEVYAAARDDGQFRMDAAVKILKRGLDTDDVLQRFERERNILARLSHPNIARLLDAGATPDGRPYYVMERVAGRPITAYCRGRELGTRDVLQLVRCVCEAVDAAHRSLIVHRDLKPSNVLVTDAGEVKLLDFGVAKVIAAEGDGTRTLAQDTRLTPAYAAPEQILGGVVTTATDVYALGVMLFVLLTGRFPHRREGVPLVTIVAKLHDETTERPSRLVAREPAGRIRARELKGDLDMIVLKALHADPARRYLSAHDLGADLQRYLGRLPVEARPDSFGYRFGRLLQRHPLASAAAGVAVLALVVGFVVALWQAGIARQQAVAAQKALATAAAVTEFLNQDLLGRADPRQGPTKGLTVRAMLDRAAESVDARFASEPAAAAQVHATLGRAYQGIGEFELARTQLERAAELFTAAEGSLSFAGLDTRIRLAAVLSLLGHIAESCTLMQSLEQQFTDVFPAGDERGFLLHVSNLKCRLRGLEDHDALIAEMGTVVADLEQRGMTSSPSYLLALQTLAIAAFDNERYEEAELNHGKLVAYRERELGAAHVTTVRQRGIWAGALTFSGRLAEADTQLRRAFEDARSWAGEGSTDADYLNGWDLILKTEQGRFAEAERIARRSLKIEERRYTYRLGVFHLLGLALLEQGRLEEAIRYLREAVEYNRDIGLLEYDVMNYTMWSDALLRLGRIEEAREIFARVTDVHLGSVRHDQARWALYRRMQGLLALKAGQNAEGRGALQESLDIYQRIYGPEHWRTRRARDELARIPAR